MGENGLKGGYLTQMSFKRHTILALRLSATAQFALGRNQSKKNWARYILVCGFGAFLLTALACRATMQQPPPAGAAVAPTPVAATAHKDYAEIVRDVANKRAVYAERYAQATPAARREILRETAVWLRETLDKELFPPWYGTTWDFYGTTETPRNGKIACGYFVTTVLRDAGFQLERARLAQQASEKIILSLVEAKYVQRFRNASLEDFVAAVRQQGAGLYVVGLDFHVGFILHNGQEVYFVHSAYANPAEVMKEVAARSPILGDSKYRVLGALTADDQLLAKLLNGTKIKTLR